jgi:hypothetical protein
MEQIHNGGTRCRHGLRAVAKFGVALAAKEDNISILFLGVFVNLGAPLILSSTPMPLPPPQILGERGGAFPSKDPPSCQ